MSSKRTMIKRFRHLVLNINTICPRNLQIRPMSFLNFPSKLYTRNVSYYCKNCFDNIVQSYCEGYTSLTVEEKKKNKDRQDKYDVLKRMEQVNDIAGNKLSFKKVNVNAHEND